MLESNFQLTQKEKDLIEKVAVEAAASFSKTVADLMKKYEGMKAELEVDGNVIGNLGPSLAVLNAVHQASATITGLMSELMLVHIPEGTQKQTLREAMEMKAAIVSRNSKEIAEDMRNLFLGGNFNIDSVFKN